MEKKLRELIAELFRMEIGRVTDDLAMHDTDVWDSLKHMELVVAIEETFDTQLSFDDIVAMQSVGEIKRILNERGIA